jgi:hypothetical protein
VEKTKYIQAGARRKQRNHGYQKLERGKKKCNASDDELAAEKVIRSPRTVLSQGRKRIPS